MAAFPSAPRGPQGSTITPAKSPVAAHPITSAAIGLLIAVSILGTLIVPIYARITPKVGDWPFFYFYLIVYIPVAALLLWAAMMLQRRLKPGARAGDGGTR